MAKPQDFKRTIGLISASAIVVGSVIGSGIFVRPADMSALLGSPSLVFLAWFVAAAFSFFNAIIQAEVGAMIPETGGQYTFMRYMFGDFWAWLYGWASFAVINTAGTAAICFIGALYSDYFLHLPRLPETMEHSICLYLPGIGNLYPLENISVKLLTIFYLIILTILNYRSTKAGSRFQSLLTGVKLISIGFIIFGFFLSGKGSLLNLETASATIHPQGIALIMAFAAACTGALFSFDGWGNLIFMMGEIKSPQRTLPLALLSGLLICTVCYIAVTLAYFYLLPVDAVARSPLVASDAATIAFGSTGAALIAFFIIISAIGCVNANVLTPPRLSYTMGRDRLFFPAAAKIHPTFETPSGALLLHLGWMILIVFVGSFYVLADMFVFVTWCFNLMMIIGFFRLRMKMPEANRPFKAWGYPWLPAIVLCFTFAYLCLTLYNDIDGYRKGTVAVVNSLFGILLTVAGIPIYLYYRLRLRKP